MLLVAPATLLMAQHAVDIPTADGGVVRADVYGTGPRGVVLAHGGRFDRASWKPQALELAAAGFRVVSIDFRAAVEMRAGNDTPCLYDPACLAKDILAAVRYLSKGGATSVAVVGGSLGGGGAAQATLDGAAGEIDRVVLLAHMSIPAPERMRGRKLFITARDDVGGNGQPRLIGIRDQYAKAPDPKDLVVLDGSAHAQALFDTASGPRLMQEIVRFLAAP
jgi:predicted alpha/beta-hydrolase family hydrolase